MQGTPPDNIVVIHPSISGTSDGKPELPLSAASLQNLPACLDARSSPFEDTLTLLCLALPALARSRAISGARHAPWGYLGLCGMQRSSMTGLVALFAVTQSFKCLVQGRLMRHAR